MRALRVSSLAAAALLGAGFLGSAGAEDLAAYAATCDTKVGVSVEPFDCTKGFVVPTDEASNGRCSKPPYLPSASCHAGSRLGVQDTGNPKIAIVWLCRKKEITDPSNADFDDVAVIQTNFETGATCWYQKLAAHIDGSSVPAPRDNSGFWFQPAETAGERCAACHDTGLLRTPYLTQVVNGEGKRVLPRERHTDKYWFPGEDFKPWKGKVMRIKDTASPLNCTKCHAMGANQILPNFGTSTWLGLMASGQTITDLLISGTYGQHAHWMDPGRSQPNAADKLDAVRMKECASGLGTNCTLEPWGAEVAETIDELAQRELPRLARPSSARLAQRKRPQAH